MTEGTTRLYADYQPEKITDGAIANMRQTSRTPESRQRQRTNKIGKPAHPATIQALARAARRKKTEAHRRAIARAVSDWWAKQPSPHSPVDSSDRSWTEQEDRALGVTLDRHVAAMTGRTIPAVRSRRKQLGIHESRHSRLHHEPKAK